MTSLEQADSDLDAFILGDLEFDMDGEPDEIRDQGEADKIGYVIACIDSDIARDAELFDDRITKARKMVADLEQRKADALKPLRSKRDWFESRLEGWTRANISETARRKTINLPFVSVSLRGQQETVKLNGKPGEHVPEPLTRADWATVTDIKKVTQRGPAMDVEEIPDWYTIREGWTPHKVMVGDQVVPGAVWEKPDRDRFECKPMSVERPEPVEAF